MPFFASAGRALSAATLLITLAGAQQCYYPDGSTSNDVACGSSGESSCCASDSWCMDNGLCFDAGLVSRGSCTDQTWSSAACTSFCRTVSPSSSIPIMPCSADGSFACGLNSTSCSDSSLLFSMSGSGSFVLRPSQVEALVAPAISSIEAAASATLTSFSSSANASADNTAGLYTSSEMAGLGCGLGLPLLAALGAIAFLLYRRRTPEVSEIYNLPDTTHLRPFSSRSYPTLSAASRDGDDGNASLYSTQSSAVETPEHMKSFFERYKTMGQKTPPAIRVQEVRVELDGSAEVQRIPHRHELASPTRSTFEE